MQTYNDIAIPLSWPDKTARGDEGWMAFFKRIGIIKNLNFKVGHAAILLVQRSSGLIKYYDFGRYIVPRGYGRARSNAFDPRLVINTRAKFSSDGSITNIEDVLKELKSIEDATHGGGRLLYSICPSISFLKGDAYAEKIVADGPILYGAIAPNNNSCSRYVAQVLTEAMEPEDSRIRKILYPESLKASPTSNVVNAANKEGVMCYHDTTLHPMPMTRRQSLLFQFRLIKDNFTKQGSKTLGIDSNSGWIDAPGCPKHIPKDAQWLGGIGEGAWFHLQHIGQTNYLLRKYNTQGEIEYTTPVYCIQQLDLTKPHQFTFHFTHNNCSIEQNNNLLIFKSDPDRDQSNSEKDYNIKAIS
ncbi:MAG: DUF6695 family protein [Sphingobacterium sp.]|uniref:DUF6695 family protein n=1 Tax=Sphingobacterium sp. JB170 TaxID=1434842 RepID=UPI00097F4203|nr:DUF6695 family protein [Sphingobacterium sp. JB170]SJN43997.1 hypothetical protein FM107_12655 [Sphingobacterium sp. JB170]